LARSISPCLKQQARLLLFVFFLLAFPYLGFLLGIKKPEWLEPAFLVSFFRSESEQHIYKLLDTSVIIDGRIAEICETGFIDGELVVPQFVLKELQLVADSADSLKRQRGRGGWRFLTGCKIAQSQGDDF